MPTIAKLETQLSNFDLEARMVALNLLIDLAERGEVTISRKRGTPNKHIHTFNSFNWRGWSPQRTLWEAYKKGVHQIGHVEFDVLDELETNFIAADLLGLAYDQSLETRAVCPEFYTAGQVLNSPGEPGVSYVMGVAFTRLPAPGQTREFLAQLAASSRNRNLGVAKRVNSHLGKEAAIDYDKDAVILTPHGNIIERHMVRAYVTKAARYFGDDKQGLVSYWAQKLNAADADIAKVIDDEAKFEGMVRQKLMKKGGVGYVQPDEKSFPNIKKFFDWVRECGALPTATWLDGTSNGEADPYKLLEYYKSMGAVLLNIIPDRNFNPKTPMEQDKKYQNLIAIIEAAQKLGMPLCMGTEMNTPGNRFLDNWFGKHLAPYRQVALNGAEYIHAHTSQNR